MVDQDLNHKSFAEIFLDLLVFVLIIVLLMSICIFLNVMLNNITSILSLYILKYSKIITHIPVAHFPDTYPDKHAS